MAVASKRLILEEFLKLPEEEPPLEFMHGRVTQKVSPKGRHSALQIVDPADYSVLAFRPDQPAVAWHGSD